MHLPVPLTSQILILPSRPADSSRCPVLGKNLQIPKSWLHITSFWNSIHCQHADSCHLSSHEKWQLYAMPMTSILL